MGAFAAIAGVIYCGLQTYFSPVAFLGKNMQVLAAVVLGGASTRGGKGTVIGTFLGTILIGLINQSLVYLGVDTQWYDAVIGTIFIIYATFQSLTSVRNE
jgi:simple sugar transport system permease protein